MVLVHQKVAHRISPNYSPHIRYQCYFRLSHRDHRPLAPLRGVWSNFEGLAAEEEMTGEEQQMREEEEQPMEGMDGQEPMDAEGVQPLR